MFKKVMLAAVMLLMLCTAAYTEPLYEVEVDLTSQIVTVYRGSDRSDDAVVRQMICSSGAANSTPKGTFFVFTRDYCDRKEWYYIKYYYAYVQYSTRFYNDYMFHSLPYKSKNLDDIDRRALAQMGTPASHGCIRLYSEDAYWMSMNIADGTKVHIFNGDSKQSELRKLLLESTFSTDGIYQNYREFLGYSDDENVIDRDSDSESVIDLQRKLREYGYYTGMLSGTYDSETLNTVREIQNLLNMPATGLANPEFMQALDEGRVPPTERVTLSVGSEGPAVRALQTSLAKLKYYTGPVDGMYTEELGESVRLFRIVRRMAESTEADENVQKTAKNEAQTREIPENAVLTISPYEALMGTVKKGQTLGIRKAKQNSSDILCYVKEGEDVFVLEQYSSGWVCVKTGNITGYLQATHMKIGNKTLYAEIYETP